MEKTLLILSIILFIAIILIVIVIIVGNIPERKRIITVSNIVWNSNSRFTFTPLLNGTPINNEKTFPNDTIFNIAGVDEVLIVNNSSPDGVRFYGRRFTKEEVQELNGKEIILIQLPNPLSLRERVYMGTPHIWTDKWGFVPTSERGRVLNPAEASELFKVGTKFTLGTDTTIYTVTELTVDRNNQPIVTVTPDNRDALNLRRARVVFV